MNYHRAIKALNTAMFFHKDQKRKYSGMPYIMHPLRVGAEVLGHHICSPVTVAAAYLHDTIEDTDYTSELLELDFGPEVARLVDELTNKTHGLDLPRAKRKAMDRKRLLLVSYEAKIIKLIDRIDNLNDGLMAGAENQFKAIYCSESLLLCTAIGDADQYLRRELYSAIHSVSSTIEEGG